ncbi:MAG: LacI family DNA-binding transcriptional regulator [Bacteroidota bacterium]
MPPTIYDIAKKARVGIGTVSRVFNNHPSVSPATKDRVLRVANKLQYHPHPYARGLARRRTNSILAVIPFFSTFFFIEVLQGVQATLSTTDYDLLLFGITHLDHIDASLKRIAGRNRADGILYFSMEMPEAFATEYLQQKVPLILVDTYHRNFDSFQVDNTEGAAIATKHLVDLGHQRIGILLANLESPPAKQRREGFERAMHEAGLPVQPEWVKWSNSSRLDGFTREDGYLQMKEFLKLRSSMPSAIFVSSDIQASGALSAIEEAGLRCPDDVALVGFDDIELAGHLGLTTMRQPMAKMGLLAALRLAERMENPALPAKQTTFVPELIVRKTSGAGARMPVPVPMS